MFRDSEHWNCIQATAVCPAFLVACHQRQSLPNYNCPIQMQSSGQYDNVESTALAKEDRADNSDVPKIQRESIRTRRESLTPLFSTLPVINPVPSTGCAGGKNIRDVDSAIGTPDAIRNATHSARVWIQLRRIIMRIFGMVAGCIVTLSLLYAMPLNAQIDYGMNFTTSFAFYAGNTKMPAGSYKITQAGSEETELLIESQDGKYSAFLDFIPTQSEQPHAHSDVTFHKYGNTDYIDRIWVEGQQFGMKVEPTKAEQKAAASVAMVEHSVSAKKR
jgi:hypothetical protein